MYPKWMAFILRFFDIWGNCTEFSKSRFYRIFIHVILLINIVFGINTAIEFKNYLHVHSNDTLGTVNDTIKLNGFQLIFWITIIEAYVKRKSQRRFWEIMKEIDKKYCCHQRFLLRSYVIEFSIFIGYFVIVKIFYEIRLMTESIRSKSFWNSFDLVCNVYEMHSFYHLFYLKLIEYELTTIKHETQNLNQNFQSKMNKNFKKFGLQRIKWVRNYYTLVYDLCSTLNHIFGRSNIFYIPFSFLLITTELNWVYWKLFNKYETDKMIGKSSMNLGRHE